MKSVTIDAMHAGTLAVLWQLGAPGIRALVICGFRPTMLSAPSRKDPLRCTKVWLPANPNAKLWFTESLALPAAIVMANMGWPPQPVALLVEIRLLVTWTLNASLREISPQPSHAWLGSTRLPQLVFWLM